jgi:hypothetical protein
MQEIRYLPLREVLIVVSSRSKGLKKEAVVTFNKSKFASMLQKAQGTRTFNEYATDSGISPAHISRLTRQLIDNAPTTETLHNLSLCTSNGVTYEDLVQSLAL